MNYVSSVLRIFIACVAAAAAALCVWYAMYAIMWLLMWLVATLAACGAAWLVGNYVNERLGGAGAQLLGTLSAKLHDAVDSVKARAGAAVSVE